MKKYNALTSSVIFNVQYIKTIVFYSLIIVIDDIESVKYSMCAK